MYAMRKNINETPFFKIHIVLAMQKEKKQLPNANDLKEKYLNPTTNLQFFFCSGLKENLFFSCAESL